MTLIRHKQPATTVQTDNYSEEDVFNSNTNEQKSRAVDDRFYLLRDRIYQKNFRFFWKSVRLNKDYYFSKYP